MPVERKAGDVGSKLREARERKGVSLRDIANATKISSHALEALERNEVAHLPGGIFSRSFVRAYATAVGLDPETTVEDFVRQFPHDSITAGHPPSTRIDDGDSIENERRMATVVLRLVALSVPIAGVVLYFGLSDRRTSGTTQPAASAVVRTEAPGASAAVPTDRASRLTVELVATRACAISAGVDAQPSTDLQLEAGERRTFDAATELTLKVSDPAAIEWSINGVPGRALGTAGAAASVRLTASNYKDYLAVR